MNIPFMMNHLAYPAAPHILAKEAREDQLESKGGCIGKKLLKPIKDPADTKTRKKSVVNYFNGIKHINFITHLILFFRM